MFPLLSDTIRSNRIDHLRSLARRGLLADAAELAHAWKRSPWGGWGGAFDGVRAEVALGLARYEDAARLSTRAISRLGSGAPGGPHDTALSRAALTAAEAELGRGDPEAAAAALGRISGCPAGPRRLLVEARIAASLSDRATARAGVEAAAREALRERDRGLYAEALLLRALVSRGIASVERVEEDMGRASEVARGSRRRALEGEALAIRSDLRTFRGDWVGARRDAETGGTLFRDLRLPHEHMCAARSLALTQIARLEADAARTTLRRAIDGLRPGLPSNALVELHLLLSDVCQSQNATGAAFEAATRALEACGPRDADARARAHVRRSIAALAADQKGVSLREARLAARVAPEGGFARALAQLALGRALIGHDAGRAAAAFESALALHGLYEPLRLSGTIGLALARGAAASADAVTSAVHRLREFGDLRIAAIVDRDLRALGGPASAAGPIEIRTHAVTRELREVLPSVFSSSAAMERVADRVRRAAGAACPVIVFGETGTGKELIARAIHALSGRRGAFVPVNAPSVSDELFESELFGHVRGAFTGAQSDRAGLVEQARGGTLFIDEIADLSGLGQSRLLRFLQDGAYRRVGESTERRADVRIVVAANRRLSDLVTAGRFREDLLYRLRDVEIDLPPLRERGADAVLLAERCVAGLAREGGVTRLSDAARATIGADPWPGNVRELLQEVRRATLFADGACIVFESRRRDAAPHAADPDLRAALARCERELLASVLATCPERTEAARRLGITRQALHQKIVRHALR